MQQLLQKYKNTVDAFLRIMVCVNMGIMFDLFESLGAVFVVLFLLLRISGISYFIKFCEDGHREMMNIGLIKSTKTWI